MVMFSPNRKPKEFGFKGFDTHIVVNAATRTAKAYDVKGKLLWEKPCLADGQHPNWRANQGDTPPGLYKPIHYAKVCTSVMGTVFLSSVVRFFSTEVRFVEPEK
jgi:hypothetical protein